MIVVNLNRSYPKWAQVFAPSAPENLHQVKMADLADLATITAGDWWRISDMKIAQYGDLLVGCYEGQIVSVYHITGHTQSLSTSTVRFNVKAATEYASLIGGPQPGGPWRQGEARGSRNLDSDEYAARYKSAPSVRAWKHNTAEVAITIAAVQGRDPNPPAPVTHPAAITVQWPHHDPITLTWTSNGILQIAVPKGTKTRTIQTEPVKKRRRRGSGPAQKT